MTLLSSTLIVLRLNLASSLNSTLCFGASPVLFLIGSCQFVYSRLVSFGSLRPRLDLYLPCLQMIALLWHRGGGVPKNIGGAYQLFIIEGNDSLIPLMKVGVVVR